MPITAQQVRRGALWTYGQSFISTFGQFLVGVILARLLTPGDFGLFIAVTAFTTILLNLAQSGLSAALLQAKTLTEKQTNAAFWTISLIAAACVALLAAIAQPLGRVYDSANFVDVMYLMCSAFILIPYNAISLALLRRQMKFDLIARIGIRTMMIVSLIEILAALLGAGVYSLVLGSIASMIILTYFFARHLNWRPCFPSFSPVRALLGYSGSATVNSALNFLTGRVDNMLVGALLGTSLLGLYRRAYSLSRMPVEKFSTNLNQVLFGSLSRIQEDLTRSRRLYFKATSAIAILTMPFLILLLCVGPEMVEFIYGEQWTAAGPPLQLMVPGVFFVLISSSLRPIIQAQGLVYRAIPINAAALGVTILGILALHGFGLVGIAVAISLREALSLGLIVRLLSRSQVALTPSEIGFAVVPAFIAGLFSLAAGLMVMTMAEEQGTGLGLLLVAVGMAVFSTYLAAIAILMVLWREHQYLMSTRDLIISVLADMAARIRDSVAARHAAAKKRPDSTEFKPSVR